MERRGPIADRRRRAQDRRNPERVASDFHPRRNPETGDRRRIS